MAYKPKTRREQFLPKGGSGLAVEIFWGSKFTPELTHQYRPLVEMVAALADHVRERIRDRSRGPDGSRLGPGVRSGAMWRSLQVAASSKKRGRGAVVKFGRSSVPYDKLKDGSVVPRPGAKKVRNRDKAKFVSGLGFAPFIDWDNRRLASVMGQSRGAMVEMRKMRRAAGGGRPVSILKPSRAEADAIVSMLHRWIPHISFEHNGPPSRPPIKGDRRLAAKIKHALRL